MSEAAAGRDLVALPRAAVLMLWVSAYLRGDMGPDDAAQMSYGVGRSGPSGEGEDLFAWMTGLRRLPLAQLRLVLPVPGRLDHTLAEHNAIFAAIEAGDPASARDTMAHHLGQLLLLLGPLETARPDLFEPPA